MKAIVQDRYGSPDVLRLTEVLRPEPGDSEVLVRVQAASVNAKDWHVMRGDPYIARLASGFGLRTPKTRTPGTDFAGRVEAVGPAVTRFKPGDEVFGDAPGTFAEYACAAEDRVERRPDNLTPEQAAAIPLAANTALIGLRDVARLEPGSSLLINGASGGVGTFAVQLAKAYGADVTAVCSTRNVDLVRSLGADHVIDYTREDFADGSQHYDLILDIGGNSRLSRLRRALTPRGTLVIAGGENAKWTGVGRQIRALLLSLMVRQRLTMYVSRHRQADLDALNRLIEAGQVTPVIGQTYQLSDAPAAIRQLAEGHAQGKLVITI